jgi:hypothetical protein
MLNLSLSKGFALALCFVAVSCGQITIGPAADLDDPMPQGAIVGAGSFQSQNGKTVTGSVTVIKTLPSEWVIHISGLDAPIETGLQVVAVITPTPSTTVAFSLKAASGNQNYTVSGLTGSSQFVQVKIRSGILPSKPDYGVATFSF